MKKLVLIVMAVTFAIGGVQSQTKKAPVKRSTTSVAAKKKAEAEAKAKAEAEEAAEKARVEESARKLRNSNCYFTFDTGVFVSKQGTKDYVVYEIPNMTASELKSAIFTTLSSMYKSPKDAITNLSDNMIQLEGYKENIYYFRAGSSTYFNDIAFNMVIQFKDGKVRYNSPTIKMLHIGGPLGKSKADMSLGIPRLISKEEDRKAVYSYFSSLLYNLNSKLQKSNDW